MKKVFLGSIMFLTGILSTATILGGSMAYGPNMSGIPDAYWSIAQLDLMTPIYLFIFIAVLGLALAIWGLFDNKN